MISELARCQCQPMFLLSQVQGYTSDGRAAATLRRRGSQIGARDADGSTDDDLGA